MKLLTKLTLAVAALVVSVFTASAQVGPNTITLSTNRLTAATTNTTAGTAFDIGGTTTVTVGLTAYGTNAAAYGVGDAAATITLRFYGSLDGTTYYQDGTNLDVVLTPAATNSASTVARLSTTSWRYLQPTKLMSTHTNANSVHFPSAAYWYK